VRRTPPEQATLEAAEWIVQLRGDALSPKDRERFADWLRASPAHIREFLAASELWEVTAQVDPDRKLSSDPAALAATVARLPVAAQAAAPPPLAAAPDAAPAAAVRRPWRGTMAAMAAGAAVIAVGWLGLRGPADASRMLETAVGEQRSVALSDGSIVELNTNSAVQVALTAQERHVYMRKGEVYFDVAKDPGRPFFVHVGEILIRVVGTRFNVQQRDDISTVTVLEGKVTVDRAVPAQDAPVVANGNAARAGTAPTAGVVVLQPGQQARFGGEPEVAPRRVDTGNVIAWTDRRLVFDDAKLDDILDEFNRYNAPRLVVADPELAALRLTGVFRSNDPDSLLEFLRQSRDMRIVDRADGTRELQPAPR
jgi:transmembrane sensor